MAYGVLGYNGEPHTVPHPGTQGPGSAFCLPACLAGSGLQTLLHLTLACPTPWVRGPGRMALLGHVGRKTSTATPWGPDSGKQKEEAIGDVFSQHICALETTQLRVSLDGYASQCLRVNTGIPTAGRPPMPTLQRLYLGGKNRERKGRVGCGGEGQQSRLY